MRRVATALETGAASLYAHVVDKDDLAELLVGRLCAEIELPQPNPQTAAWAIDALLLYVTAFCLETSLLERRVDEDGWTVSRDDMIGRFTALPDTFPNTKRYAAEMTSGTPLDRFDFTVDLMVGALGAPRRNRR
jgi:AcrR family transcriptional regulator